MKLLLTFTFNVSLNVWFKSGLLFREILLYKKLKENGIDISFLTFGDNQDLQYKKFLNGINIIPVFDFVKSRNRNISLLKSFLLPLKLKKVFKNVDIIKTNQLEGSWIASIAKLLYQKKMIVRGGFEWLRTYTNSFNARTKKNYLKYFLNYLKMYLFEFFAYKLADIIILTSDQDIDFIIKKFNLKKKKERIIHISNFIDTKLFKPLNLVKKDKHILYIGKLYHAKNLLNLIRAFEDLNGFTLDIVGGGPQENQLKKITEKLALNINFLGVIPNNLLPEIINKYPIFILPSYWEGNPKVLLEAMSCGVACIGTNVRGINNIIKHKVNGFLCETDSKSIADAIRTLYQDNNLRNSIVKKAREYILRHCALNSIAEKEFLLYKKLLK